MNDNRPQKNYNNKPSAPVKKPPLDKLTYVKQAQTVISDEIIKDKKNKPILSTNQIRNILTMTNELYNAVRFSKEEKLSDDICSHIQYTKMKIAYSAGKDTDNNKAVRDFVKKSCLMQYLDEIGDSRDKLIIFCHYAEALVAYHKFYSEDDI